MSELEDKEVGKVKGSKFIFKRTCKEVRVRG
jgi:hypothetical protein